MASYAYTFTSGDTVTPTKLNNARTVSEIVNADVSNSAAIVDTKLAKITTAGKVGGGAITDGTIGGSTAINTTGAITTADTVVGRDFFSDTYSSANPGSIRCRRARGTISSPVIVQNGDIVGNFASDGYDGSAFMVAARITAEVDGSPSAGDMPGRLVFSTTADGASAVTERMRINAIGNVGIGTASPTFAFGGGVQVKNATESAVRVTCGSNTGMDVVQGSSGFCGLFLRDNAPMLFTTNDLERMRIDASGNVGIGTTSPAYTLHVNGSVAGTSAYNNLSDVREKENIAYGIADALETVKALKPAKFDFKTGEKNKIGFIAQDVLPLVPEVITSYKKTLEDDTKEERLSIQESSLTAVLVAAVQELTAKVEALEAA